MADSVDDFPPSPPPPKPPVLDAQSLAAVRDQLADYLSAVERNTDSVNGWLTANKKKIVLFNHRLEQAMDNKDLAQALSLVVQMSDKVGVDAQSRKKMIEDAAYYRSAKSGRKEHSLEDWLAAEKEIDSAIKMRDKSDIAGFVLSLQDFRAKSEIAFGRDNAFQQAISGIADSLPASLQEPLPQVVRPADDALPKIDTKNMPVLPEEPKKWWSSVSGWFNKAEIERQEKEKREYNFRRELRDVKAEILGMQSDRHYYVDSFMDWVGETLAHDGSDADAAAKMLQYQNPAYIIALAHADYQEVVEMKARAVREAALEYAKIAGAIDRQDVPAIMAGFKSLGADSGNNELTHQILLEDYQSASLVEIILKHIKSRDDQAVLLYAPYNGADRALAFTDAKTPQEIFEKFLRLALDKNDPLPPEVLPEIIAKIIGDHKTPAETIARTSISASAAEKNIFQRVVERFDTDLATRGRVLTALFQGMSVNSSGAEEEYTRLCDSLQKKDSAALLKTIGDISRRDIGAEFTALWYMCHPYTSLLDKVRSISSDPATTGALLECGLQAGILGEVRASYAYTARPLLTDMPAGAPKGHRSAPEKFKQVMEENILPVLDRFPVNAARTLIAHSLLSGGLDDFRGWLTTAPENWLKEIVSDKMDEKKKLEWIAALLEPFETDIVKANILAKAAPSWLFTKGAETETLLNLEKNLVGENILLSENKALCNLKRIANIWYNSDSKMLRYTAQGQSHTLLEDVSPPMARELLSLVRRRGDFISEQDGLFRPENIDSITYDGARGTSISWFRVNGSLNADERTLDQLKNRPDFLHVRDFTTGQIVKSFNLNSICLLEKKKNGHTLLVDKYGDAYELDGQILPHRGSPLISLGADVQFNPDNASIICLDPAKNTFEFRIEGYRFEKLFHRPDQYFYSIAADAAMLSTLKGHLKKMPDIHRPNISGLSGLHFNMKALGYLALNEKASGFFCRQYNPTQKPGLIQVADAGMMTDILDSIGKAPGIIRIGDLLVHEDSIDDAYYNSNTRKLQFIIGREAQEVPASPKEGWETLYHLAMDKKFSIVTRETGVLHDTPADVVHMARATLLFHSPAQERTHIITENMPFYVNLTGAEALAFFRGVEKKGLESAIRESASEPWTQELRGVMGKLPPLDIKVPALLDMQMPKTLLNLPALPAKNSKTVVETAAAKPQKQKSPKFGKPKFH